LDFTSVFESKSTSWKGFGSEVEVNLWVAEQNFEGVIGERLSGLSKEGKDSPRISLAMPVVVQWLCRAEFEFKATFLSCLLQQSAAMLSSGTRDIPFRSSGEKLGGTGSVLFGWISNAYPSPCDRTRFTTSKFHIGRHCSF
jgi:hypothetical protein